MSLVLYNSIIYAENQVPVNYNNRAFKFGDGFFETIRANGVYPMHFQLHYHRMIKAMMSLKMDVASLPRMEELHDLLVKLLQKNKCYGSSRVRIEVIRRGEGLYTPLDNKVDFLVEVKPLNTTQYEMNEKGLLVGVYRDIQKSYNPLSFFKSVNSLHYILAAISKNEMGVHDCLLINDDKKIIEASSSNLFCIHGNVIYTPSVFSGCVDGVMRNVVMDLIKNHTEFVLRETQGFIEENLMEAEEIFITNAIQGIQWVVGMGERRFFNKKIRLLSGLLNEEYCS